MDLVFYTVFIFLFKRAKINVWCLPRIIIEYLDQFVVYAKTLILIVLLEFHPLTKLWKL